MALDAINTVDIIECLENFVSRIRPPEKIRHEVDINYRIENQSIFLFEIRPFWQDKTQYKITDFAKATYVKKDDVWKVYWQRASLKWELYEPCPMVQTLPDFLKLVEADDHHCFKG